MSLPFLEHFIRIQEWIFIVKANHQSSVEEASFLVVHEWACVYIWWERPVNCVHNKTWFEHFVVNLPDFFEANTIVLVTSCILFQIKVLFKSFCQGSSATFCENCLLGFDLDSGSKSVFLFSIFADTHIARNHSIDLTSVSKQNLISSYSRQNIYAKLFSLFT